MPPKAKNAETAAGGGKPPSLLTLREQKIVLHTLLSIKTDFPAGMGASYHEVAKRMGLATHRSVYNAWSVIKRTMVELEEEYRSRVPAASSSKEVDDADTDATANVDKASADADADSDAAEDSASPVEHTKAKGKKRARTAGKAVADADADIDAAAAARKITKIRVRTRAPKAADAEDDEEGEDAKREAGMIKLKRVIDEDGFESFESGDL